MAIRAPTAEEQAIAAKLATINDPMVFKSYQNDPRVALANTLSGVGTSTDPVASGNWGIGEGLSRIASGFLGGHLGRKERDRYSAASKVASANVLGASAPQLAEAAGVDPAIASVAQPTPGITDVKSALKAGGAALAGAGVNPAAQAAPVAMNAVQGPGVTPLAAPIDPNAAAASGVANALTPRPGPSPVGTAALPASVADQSMAVANPTPAPVPSVGRGAQAVTTVPVTDATGRLPGITRTATKQAVQKNSPVVPVTDGRSAALAVYPGLKITDNRRNPASRLGKANPKSWHVRSAAAIDSRPVPGMTFDQYVEGYRKAGYNIVEAIDEVKNPSGHATGPHWHVVLGKRRDGQPDGAQEAQSAQAPQAGQVDTGIEPPPFVAEAELPEAAAPVERPKLGDRVRSARLQIAHNLLTGDTGDLSADFVRGLVDQYATPEAWKEDQEAKLQRDRDEAQMAQTEFQSNLSRRNAMDQARYQAEVDEYGDTRDFNRDLKRDQYGFGFQRSERLGGQEFTRSERIAQQNFEAEEARLDRQQRYKEHTEKLIADGKRDEAAIWLTPTGAKLFQEAMTQADAGAGMTATGRRVLAIAEQFESGGLTRAGMPRDALAAYDKNIAELRALQKEAVTNKLGGKLGAGVSNADFEALSQATPIGPGTPPPLLKREAQRMVQLGNRKEDYNRSYIKHYAANPTQFADRWGRYVDMVRLYDDKGNISKDGYISYDEWLDAALKAGRVK